MRNMTTFRESHHGPAQRNKLKFSAVDTLYMGVGECCESLERPWWRAHVGELTVAMVESFLVSGLVITAFIILDVCVATLPLLTAGPRGCQRSATPRLGAVLDKLHAG